MLPNKILGFDGLRGVAVTLVVLTHLDIIKFIGERKLLPDSLIVLFQGYVGVQIFFVLSGFLITMLLIKEFDTTRRISFKKFYIRRTLRIFPIYFLSLFLVTILNFCHVYKVGTGTLILAYIYLYNFIPNSGLSMVVDYSWSLAVEEHFYLVWPPILSVALKQNRNLILFGIGFMIFISFLLYNLVSLFPWSKTHFLFLIRWTVFSGGDILVGCFFALLLTGFEKNNDWVRIFKSRYILFFGVFLFANCLLFHSMAFHLLGYVRCVGVGIVVGWVYLNQSSWLVKVLEFVPLKFIGLISYGIYIWQGFFLSSGPERMTDQHWPPVPTVGFLLLVIMAPLSYYFIERPFLQFKTKF